MASTPRAVVIGTGAGGLTAAAFLAKDGFDVVAFEQADRLGGWLASFERGGYRFDPGLHYLGECGPGEAMSHLLDELGVGPVAFDELDPDGFDVYRFPGFEVRRCRGLEPYLARLAAVFPRERDGLARLFELLEDVRATRDALQSVAWGDTYARHLGALARLPAVLRWRGRTFGELLAAWLADPRARAVLAGASGLYALPPGRTPAPVALATLVHFTGGAYVPRGGSSALRDALVAAGEHQGVRFHARARVVRVVTRAGRAVGVELASGERVAADVVVSDADPVQVLGRLVDPSVLSARWRERVRGVEPSLGTFTLYLGMRRDLAACGLGRSNVWSYPGTDLDALYAPLFAGRLPDEPMLFLSPNSLKDRSGSHAPDGASTLEVTTLAPYALFRPWRDAAPGARGPGYDVEKQRLVQRVLTTLEARFPGLVGDVEVEEAATPLTSESYTLAVEGGGFGPAATLAQSGARRFRARSPVPGLVFAGAGTLGGGVVACALSGRLASHVAARGASRRLASAPWASGAAHA